jgi:NADPH-dependent curcumin reductase CurA
VVVGARGWQTHSVTPGERLVKLPRHGAPLSAYLGVLGMPGATAYRGITEICQPKKGETVVISAASGAVGSVAGQLAKRAGARVVGVAGGAEKCLWVQDSLGFDDCVDHRSLDLERELAAACPNGIDAYFENVGGAVQAAVFDLLNPFARVAMCGMVSQYNEAEFPPGPNLGFVVGKRGKPDLPRGRGGRAGERARRAGGHAERAQLRQAAGPGRGGSGLAPAWTITACRRWVGR